jgi:hypothetical protein
LLDVMCEQNGAGGLRPRHDASLAGHRGPGHGKQED